jgi:uroporphyrinogen decarboxylase
MPEMSRRDRLRAAAASEATDRPPYAFWRHFPAADRSPAALAQATLRFHDRYGSDFLAVMPPAGYAAQAWGCVEGEDPGLDGTRPCARCAVTRPEDWGAVRPLDPAGAPGYGEVLEALVRLGFDRRIGDAPVLIMLQAPFTVAARLGGGRLAADLREWPGLVTEALQAIAETQLRFATLCLAEGLAGVLYLAHLVPDPALGPGAYAAAAEPHDRAILAALGGQGGLRVVHGAGPIPLERLAELPADLLGWAPGTGCLPVETPIRGSGRALLGGLDARTLAEKPPDASVAAARAALAARDGRGLVIAPGGPVWPGTPDETLAAIVRALGGTTRPILGLTR